MEGGRGERRGGGEGRGGRGGEGRGGRRGGRRGNVYLFMHSDVHTCTCTIHDIKQGFSKMTKYKTSKFTKSMYSQQNI